MSEPRVPRWYRFAWFLGRAPTLTTRQWRVLGLVAAVSFFEQYDSYLFALNLVQIQADLHIAEADLGLLGSAVRAGALLSIFMTLAADRLGRRRLLLFTVLGYTVLTGATALAPNAESFVILQCLARGFASAETLLAAVVIVEEFNPEHRGWGIGAAAAIQATGAGFASIMFGFVEILPYGWRALYAIGLVPLAIIAYWRRRLPETHRFEALQALRAADPDPQPVPLFASIGALVTRHPGRFAALAAATILFSMAASAAGFFAPKFLQDVQGWSPSSVAILTFCGGAFAIIGNPLSGWLSDRFGRRPTTATFALAFGLMVMAFYASLGMLPALFWILLIFTLMGTDVTLSTYGGELFPTSHRSTATGARGFIATLGGIVGLAAVSGLFGLLGSNWAAISLLAGLALLVPAVVLIAFPETARRPLEEIAPDTEHEAKRARSEAADSAGVDIVPGRPEHGPTPGHKR